MNLTKIMMVLCTFSFSVQMNPAHSHPGGLDVNGCHAGSAPYHCHAPNHTPQDSDMPVSGTVTYVRDVDTLIVGEQPIRLFGIDGPELSTTYGISAKERFEEIILQQNVTCDPTGQTSYDRIVAICYLNGVDLGALLISSGLALDCPAYSNGMYERFETTFAQDRLTRAPHCQ